MQKRIFFSDSTVLLGVRPPKALYCLKIILRFRTGFEPQRCPDPLFGSPINANGGKGHAGGERTGEDAVEQLARGIPVPNPIPRMPESG